MNILLTWCVVPLVLRIQHGNWLARLRIDQNDVYCKAFLVYPRKLPDPMVGHVGQVSVEALALDLSENIDDGANQLLEELLVRVQ